MVTFGDLCRSAAALALALASQRTQRLKPESCGSEQQQNQNQKSLKQDDVSHTGPTVSPTEVKVHPSDQDQGEGLNTPGGGANYTGERHQ